MVKVFTWRGMCSGMLIANDTVLTAAHCICGESIIGGNVCNGDVNVVFQDDPATPGTANASIHGNATFHPSYNPSWVDNAYLHDLALVRLDSLAPAFVPRMSVASSLPWSNAVTVAGFGLTGGDCDGNDTAEALTKDTATIDEYETNDSIILFDDPITCPGDSGGAILAGGSTGPILGVVSMETATITHGLVDKAVAVPYHYSWIHDFTCSDHSEGSCGKGPICRCGEGGYDCNTTADCQDGLNCEQNVGASYGLPASADVCVHPGPIQGTCGCGPSGFGGFCSTSTGYNDCNPGFAAHCNPTRYNCGACVCQ
jgi:secreted trypsin-like serine protease